MLPSYCDALTDRWLPAAPAGGWPTVMQRTLNTALPVTVLCVGCVSVGCSNWKRSAVWFAVVAQINAGSFQMVHASLFYHLALTTF